MTTGTPGADGATVYSHVQQLLSPNSISQLVQPIEPITNRSDGVWALQLGTVISVCLNVHHVVQYSGNLTSRA